MNPFTKPKKALPVGFVPQNERPSTSLGSFGGQVLGQIKKPFMDSLPGPQAANAVESFGMRALGGSGTPLNAVRNAVGASLPSGAARQMALAQPKLSAQRNQAWRDDAYKFDEQRASGLSPELARGAVMGNASLAGDMRPSGEPGPQFRARMAQRTRVDNYMDDQAARLNAADPQSIPGNRTGIAPINATMEIQRQAKMKADLDAIRNNRQDFYQRKYDEAAKGPTMGVKPDMNHVKLAERLNKRGYNVTPETLAQKESQERASREEGQAMRDKLYASTGGVNPLVARAGQRRAAERSAMEDRKAQARNVRFNALQQDRYGMMPDQDLAAQRLAQQAPGAALQAMGLNSRAQGEMGIRQQEIAQKEQALQVGQANALLSAAAEIEESDPQAARQLRQTAVSMFRPPQGGSPQALPPSVTGAMAPSAQVVQQGTVANQGIRNLSPAEQLTQLEPILASVGTEGFDPQQAIAAGIDVPTLESIAGYKPFAGIPFGKTNPLLKAASMALPGESDRDRQRRLMLQDNARKLITMLRPPKG